MEQNVKEITLFGKKILLGERSAIDVLNLSESLKKFTIEQKTEPSFYLYTSATVISDALKINLKSLHWYNFFKKYTYSNILTTKNILESCTQNELIGLASQVYELEGTLGKTSEAETNDNTEKKSQV